jgi:hypothetical protein
MKGILAAAALAAALALPHAAQAQGHRGVVLAQLDTIATLKRSEGYSVATGAVIGNQVLGLLGNGASVILELNLRAGVQYFIPAGCDRDCSDLDLRMLGTDGQTVLDEDVADDDVPIVSFTPRESGPHMLVVNMAACSTESCYFGFRVFSK